MCLCLQVLERTFSRSVREGESRNWQSFMWVSWFGGPIFLLFLCFFLCTCTLWKLCELYGNYRFKWEINLTARRFLSFDKVPLCRLCRHGINLQANQDENTRFWSSYTVLSPMGVRSVQDLPVQSLKLNSILVYRVH
jgi:hypothetical protein